MRIPNSYLIIGLLFTFTTACTHSDAESTNGRASENRPARGVTSLPDFVSLAKDLQPAVVNVSAILAMNEEGAQGGAPPQDPDDK